MKKLTILLGLLFAFQFALKAQTSMDTDIVTFNAHLVETFDITVTDGEVQDIIFDSPQDYNMGVTELDGITDGFSIVTVNATANWDMTIEAPDFGPIGGTASGAIPINNLGYYILSTGSYGFGAELTLPLANGASAEAVAVTNAPIVCIGNGSGNMGGSAENTFQFHWEMGTMRNNPLGPMNQNTMFSQLAGQVTGVNFTLGDYQTIATLTLRKL